MRVAGSIVFAFAVAALGCGNEIGDSCQISTDCSATGDRICAIGNDLPGGYCSVFGCDFDTCPDEAMCVRFFAVETTNKPCVPDTEDITTDDCVADELCILSGSCVPRSAEIRYCMKTCDNDGDCRDEYECREREEMIAHGGEPVPEPGQRLGDDLQGFCAAAPATE